MANKQKVNCPKCDGKGHISGFGHIANGVCFMCNGAKEIEVDLDELRSEISEGNRIKAEWILNSTPESYEGLSFAKLNKIREFAHGGWGLQEAFPGLLEHYKRVGEDAFMAAQDRWCEANRHKWQLGS